MFALYIQKSEKMISVKKAHKAIQNLNFTDEVTKYNDNYYICAKRKALVEKAKEIQSSWILELEEELNKVKNIKF